MPVLKRLHVAKVGKTPARSGQLVELTPLDISELASSYTPDKHECKLSVDDIATAISLGAPAVLGHLDPRLVEAKGAMPAFGRVLATDTDSKSHHLYLDLELTDSLANWIEQGLYDHVSLSWYDRNDPRNPTPGKLHIRHLGWLGAEPSAMKSLDLPDSGDIEYSEATGEPVVSNVYQSTELSLTRIVTDIEFVEADEASMASMKDKTKSVKPVNEMAEDEQETEMAVGTAEAATAQAQTEPVETEPETDLEAEPEAEPAAESDVDPVLMLVSILQDGDKGYKGEISEFRPAPTAENSFLWDEAKQQFKGQFVDLSGNEEEVYDFTLTLQDDGSMTRSYRRARIDEELPGPTDSEIEAEAEADEEPTEMGECGSKKGKYKEMGEYEALTVPGSDSGMVTLSSAEYAMLKQKAAEADMLMAAQKQAERQAKLAQVADVLRPLYDMNLISTELPAEEIADAILSMDCSVREDYDDYELEFAEGVVCRSPLEALLEVLKSVSSAVQSRSEMAIEFGESKVADYEELQETATGFLPKGVVNDPGQAKLDQRARQICAEKGWDARDPKMYMTAVRLAASGK